MKKQDFKDFLEDVESMIWINKKLGRILVTFKYGEVWAYDYNKLNKTLMRLPY